MYNRKEAAKDVLQWIDEARQGDRTAFEQVMSHYSVMAYAIAYDKLRDSYLAEDAVQEAFTEAYLHLSKLREPAAFPAWFKTIVIRQCHRQYRRKQLQFVPMDDTLQVKAQGSDVAEIAEQRMLLEQLHACVAQLSANMRIAVQLFYFHGYSLQEISAYLNIPVATLKKRLFDARSKLKGTLPIADFVSMFHHLYEGGTRMLHIVNGDHVAETLRQGVVQGDILVWREVYPEGPVFVDPATYPNRSLRASYLEQALGIPRLEFIRGSEAQENQLANFHQYDEIVLWFEHDLFDQTMLCCLLHWFAERPLGNTKLSLLCMGAYPGIQLFRGLGQLSVDQMKTLSGTWQAIGQAELKTGVNVWEAYCSSEPDQLFALLEGEQTAALPFVRDAFRLHLSRLPSTYNGLGVVEQATLELVSSGVSAPTELFRQIGDTLNGLGLGDLQYWRHMAGLLQGAYPLLHIEGGEGLPDYRNYPPTFQHCQVKLTERGQQVLAGKKDRVHLNGIDEWYGGIHLHGSASRWRWDVDRGQLVACGSGE
ncbi:sigma-70 family RNA polymerase sigma factor [Paenibacillus taiwanensis]|uniref:sigma-70 family RNA polymerase sigma factor n=1 Tax=Paenibacillus taiwanensis TaxID=401638 RepID=UPI00316AD59C